MLLLWMIVALLIAGLLVFFSALRTRQSLPPLELPPGETLPRTPLQRYSAAALLIVMLLTVAAAALVAGFGPQVWWDNDAVRLTVTFLLITALMVYLAFTWRIRQLALRDDGSFDERDQLIMNRSCAGVGGAMLVVLAAWMIALIETHIETHLMPTYFLYLVFWSCVMANVAASLAGILFAGRRG